MKELCSVVVNENSLAAKSALLTPVQERLADRIRSWDQTRAKAEVGQRVNARAFLRHVLCDPEASVVDVNEALADLSECGVIDIQIPDAARFREEWTAASVDVDARTH